MTLKYVEQGMGEDLLVFVHGFGGHSGHFAPQIAALSSQYRCLAVDLPGHGGSPRQADQSILGLAKSIIPLVEDRAPARRVVLVGHSMGTRVVSELCGLAPELISACILIDGSVRASGDPAPEIAAYDTWIKQLGFEGVMALIYDTLFLEGTPPDIRALSPVSSGYSADVAREEYVGMMHWDVERAQSTIAAIHCPVLLIHSTIPDPDRPYFRLPFPEGASTPWTEMFKPLGPHVTQTRIGPCGHFPMTEMPKQTNTAIRSFLKQL